MKLKLLLIMGLLCLFGEVAAQNEDTKGLINRIKRDSTYLYGEATMPTQEEALILAKDFLHSYIEQWITENRDTSKLRSIVATDLMANCEEISLMRGNMYRAFTYVRKKNLYAIEISTITFDLPPAHPTPAPAPSPAAQPSSVITQKESTVIPAAEQTPTTPQQPEEVTPFEQLCREVCGLQSITEIEKLLLSGRYAGYIYGEITTTTQPQTIEDAILVIFKPASKQILAVLSPKMPKRKNLITKADDSTVNYPKCGAIWISCDLNNK